MKRTFEKRAIIWDTIEELRREFQGLFDIFQELQTEEPEQQLQQLDSLLYGSLGRGSSELIEKEIGILLQNLRQKAEENGLQPDAFLRFDSKKEQEIMSHIEGKSPSTRPSTASSLTKSPENMISRTLKLLPQKLPVFQDSWESRLTETVRNVRLYLHREEMQLLKDITNLRELINSEHSWLQDQRRPSSRPTVTELKNFGKNLERDYLSLSSFAVPRPPSKGRTMSNSMKMQPSQIQPPDMFKRRVKTPLKRKGSLKLKKADIRVPSREGYPDPLNISITKKSLPKKSGSVFGLELDFLEKIGLGQAVAEELKEEKKQEVKSKGMSQRFRATVSSFRIK